MNNELVGEICNVKIEASIDCLIKLLTRLIIEENKRSKNE